MDITTRQEQGREPRFVKQMTLAEFDELFPNNDACKQYLADRRWPDGVKCPRCGNPKVYTLKFKPFHWACGVCCNKPRQPYRFSVTVGTIFENTNYKLLPGSKFCT